MSSLILVLSGCNLLEDDASWRVRMVEAAVTPSEAEARLNGSFCAVPPELRHGSVGETVVQVETKTMLSVNHASTFWVLAEQDGLAVCDGPYRRSAVLNPGEYNVLVSTSGTTAEIPLTVSVIEEQVDNGFRR